MVETRVQESLQVLLKEGMDSGFWNHALFGIYGLKGQTQNFMTGVGSADAHSVFDLASLTKALVTGPLIFHLAESYGIDLDAPIGSWSSDLKSFVFSSKISLRDLLSHTSGFVPWRNFFVQCTGTPETDPRTPESKILEVYQRDVWIENQYSKDVYSDLGPTLAMYLLQKKTHSSWKHLFAKFKLEVLSFTAKDYFDFQPPHSKRDQCIPTSFCALRNRLLQGEVHDENTWALGGVSGHAGLFASLQDLDGYLNALFKSPFGRRYFSLLSPPLGWRSWTLSMPTPPAYTKQLSGHWGFTGTGLWMDPETATFAVFLSDRISKGRVPSETYKDHRNRIFAQGFKSL